jgi:hypothetical protein
MNARRQSRIAKAWWIVFAQVPACALIFLLGFHWPHKSKAANERNAFPMVQYLSANEGEFAGWYGSDPVGDEFNLNDDLPVELVEQWVVSSALQRLDQREGDPLAEVPLQRVRVHQQWW